MSTLLTLAIWVISYIAIGFVFYRSISYIRKFDYVRGSHSEVPDKFEHNDKEWQRDYRGGKEYVKKLTRRYSDTFAFNMGVFWPITGLPSLLWHLSRVDWTKQERKLVKEIQSAPRDSHFQLETALDNIREERRKKLSEEINLLESKT